MVTISTPFGPFLNPKMHQKPTLVVLMINVYCLEGVFMDGSQLNMVGMIRGKTTQTAPNDIAFKIQHVSSEISIFIL